MAGKFIRFDVNTVNSYGGRLRGGITDQYIEDKADEVLRLAVAKAPKRSGNLARSIKKKRMPSRKGYPAFMVGTTNKYARAVHEGSGQVRHWTEARNVSVLHFFWEKRGVEFFGPIARYTFRPPQRFLTNALEAVF